MLFSWSCQDIAQAEINFILIHYDEMNNVFNPSVYLTYLKLKIEGLNKYLSLLSLGL